MYLSHFLSCMKKILIGIITFIAILFASPFVLRYLIDAWYTNARSEVAVIVTGSSLDADISWPNRQIYKYISEHPESEEAIHEAYTYVNGTWSRHRWRFPQNMLDDPWFVFIINGIEANKEILKTIKTESQKLWIDYKMVLASIMSEQIRIATKWARWDLKDLIVHHTPRFLVSYNVSLGVWWIKVTTARQVVSDAKKYGYGDIFPPYDESGVTAMLTTSDYRQWVYPTYLVKNIITRWQRAGYDISHDPGVVGTLYNMGNNITREPHAHPQIGGSVITIWWKDYVYGWLSMAIYRYLTIYT